MDLGTMGSPFGFLAAGGILGFLASMWGKIKAFAWRFIGMLIRRVEIKTGLAYDHAIGYLINNYKRSNNYERCYAMAYEYVKSADRTNLVSYELLGTKTVIFWKGWIPILFVTSARTKDDSNNQPTVASPSYNHVEASRDSIKSATLLFLRGTLDVDGFFAKAAAHANLRAGGEAEGIRRFSITYAPSKSDTRSGGMLATRGYSSGPWFKHDSVRLISNEVDDLGVGNDTSRRRLDSLIFPTEVSEVIGEIKRWSESSEWYRERDIPWKRGLLLFGPPGTGKSALARAFAEDLDLPLTVFNLSELNNSSMVNYWEALSFEAPCVALIEDIDNVFHGRKNITADARIAMLSSRFERDGIQDTSSSQGSLTLTFDCLLNCIDGVAKTEGIFVIITTNDISKIDPAIGIPSVGLDGKTSLISTRPGRIDKAIELTYMTKAGKRIMAERILRDAPERLKEILDEIEATNQDETPAQFQEKCAQIALKDYWEHKV